MKEIASFRSCTTYADNIQFEPVKTFEEDFKSFIFNMNINLYTLFIPIRFNFLHSLVDEF